MYGRAPMQQCNMPCSGDNGTLCGGRLRNIIWRINLGQYKKETQRLNNGGIYVQLHLRIWIYANERANQQNCVLSPSNIYSSEFTSKNIGSL